MATDKHRVSPREGGPPCDTKLSTYSVGQRQRKNERLMNSFSQCTKKDGTPTTNTTHTARSPIHPFTPQLPFANSILSSITRGEFNQQLPPSSPVVPDKKKKKAEKRQGQGQKILITYNSVLLDDNDIYHRKKKKRPKLDREVVPVEVHRGNRGGEKEEVAGLPRERAGGPGPDEGGPDGRRQGPRGSPPRLSLGRVGLGPPRAPLALLQRRLAGPPRAAGLLAAGRPGRRRLQLLDLLVGGGCVAFTDFGRGGGGGGVEGGTDGVGVLR